VKNHKKYTPLGVLILLAVVFSSCATVTEKTARERFLEENPEYTIIYAGAGEGWDGVVNYHYEFKKPGDEMIYKEIWTFVQQDNGEWKVTGRWAPKE